MNLKRVLASVMMIGIVAAAAIGASRAFFSDIETSEDNIITAGSIDLSVDNDPQDTAFVPVEISDMKPSYVRWTKTVVKNVGTNPLTLWKHIKNVRTENNGWSESECSDAGGTWTPPATEEENGGCDSPGQEQDNIDEYIVYDIYIDGDVEGDIAEPGNNWFGGHNVDGTPVISEEAGLTVADITSHYIFLGILEPDDEITVWQSYHMRDDTGNWAQTDKMLFDIEFLGQQVNATNPTDNTVNGGEGPQVLLLENKDTANDAWTPIFNDEIWGVLTWAGDGHEFDFSSTLQAHGLQPSTKYSLIYYADPWPGDHPGAFLGANTTDSNGDLEIAGSVNLGTSLPAAGDANALGAKIWLVPASDYNNGAESTGPMTAWNPGEYLFEYYLINYTDTGP